MFRRAFNKRLGGCLVRCLGGCLIGRLGAYLGGCLGGRWIGCLGERLIGRLGERLIERLEECIRGYLIEVNFTVCKVFRTRSVLEIDPTKR